MTFDGGRSIRPCRLVWRTFSGAGVEFSEVANLLAIAHRKLSKKAPPQRHFLSVIGHDPRGHYPHPVALRMC